jgi:AcrR family transcriptional regulator
VTKPVVYDCFPSKEVLFTELLSREEQRILAKIAASLPTRADADPERTLAETLTAFLRAVADSPDAFRVIFLGAGGGGAAIAERVQRGREAQVDAIAMLAQAWLELRGANDGVNDVASDGANDVAPTARLIAHALVGAAEAAARALLAEPGRWQPETMGPMLARLIARGQGAL